MFCWAQIQYNSHPDTSRRSLEQRRQSRPSLPLLLVPRHVQHGGVHDLLLVLGLTVVVHELHVGVDQIDNDGVIHDVILILVFGT